MNIKTMQRGVYLFLFVFAILGTLTVYGQQGKSINVTGKVIDEHGNTLPGATVKVESSNFTTTADNEGNFSVSVPIGTQVSFSFVTMVPETITVKSDKPVTVVLKSYDISLGEVVITGYNQTTTRRITGSVATVDKAELQGRPLQNVDKLLQGKVAGLSVTSTSGRPGEAAQIRIRGANTITGNAEPLWVVDGIPLQKDIPNVSTNQIKAEDFTAIFNGGISGINPNDIESVTVLKDASATAIYGSRAAGGVIVVTTKRGKAGRTQINYSNYASLTLKPQRSLSLMNSAEKISWEQELWNEFSANGYNNNTHYPVIGLVGMVRSGKEEYKGLSLAEQDAVLAEAASHTTDWFDELFQNSLSQSHYLSFSGGNEFSQYYLSTGYSNNTGLVKNTSYDRYNVNAKIDMNPHRKVQVGFAADLAGQVSKGPSPRVDLFQYAYFANPYERPYHADGSYKPDRTYYNIKSINGGGYDTYTPPNGVNVFRELNETSNTTENYSGTITMNLNYKILDFLRFSGIGSYSYTNDQGDNINGRYTNAAFADRLYFDGSSSDRTYGSITQTSAGNSSYLMRGQFHFDKSLADKHLLSALAGSEIRSQKAKSVFAKRYGYDEITGNSSIPVPPKGSSDRIDYNDLISYANMVDYLSGQSIIEDAFASFYASADYSYDRKYVVSLTGRTDGSNNFGSEQQFNPTWSAGFSWNADQESFFERLSPVMSSLRLSLATGYTGNVNRQVYPQLIMDYMPGFRKTYDDYYRMGRIGNAPNKNLRWEKTRDYKVALDVGFLDNRITGLVEYYKRNSRDLVTALRVPSTTGFISQRFNTSSLENEGFEFSLNSVNIRKENFTWTTSVNVAFNENKLTKYSTPSGTVNMDLGQQVGYPLNSVFAGKVVGIDPTTGLYMYAVRPDATINGPQDLRSSDNYVYYLGTSTAPVTGGFSTGVRYKNFNVNLSGNFAIGNKIVDNINPETNYSTIGKSSLNSVPTNENDLYQNHLNVTKEKQQRWTVDNPIVDGYPRLIDAYGSPLNFQLSNPTSSNITRGSLIEDVSYLRIGSLNVSYGVADRYVKRLGLQSLGVNFSLNNLLTFTNYDGIDPETPGAVYPITRSMSLGINIGF